MDSVDEALTRIGPYSITRKLAEGGMGAIYLAVQESLDRTVAIKLLPSALKNFSEFIDRFEREAKIVAQLSHPHIVQVIDRGEWQGHVYFVMEYVEGPSLSELLKQKGALAWQEAVRIGSEVCEGLAYAHSRNVIHRDIKPANILIDSRGMARITDFGIAYMEDDLPRLTMTRAAMGTLDYMAPEQRRDSKRVDARADLYAMGAVLYECLTGKVPRGAWSPPSVVQGGLPKRLDKIVLRCMQEDREKRYESAEALKRDLDASLVSSALPVRILAVSGAILLVALGGAGLFFLKSGKTPEMAGNALTRPEVSAIAATSIPEWTLSTPEPMNSPASEPTQPSVQNPLASQDAQVLFLKGRAAYGEDELVEAQELLTSAIQKGLGSNELAEAQFVLGDISEAKGQPDEAEACYRACVKANPMGPKAMGARLRLGVIHAVKMEGMEKQGVAEIRQVLDEGVKDRNDVGEILFEAAMSHLTLAESGWQRGKPLQTTSERIGGIIEGMAGRDSSLHFDVAQDLLSLIIEKCQGTRWVQEALFELDKVKTRTGT